MEIMDIMTKLVTTLWMSTASGIGMQQIELFQFYLSIENKLHVVGIGKWKLEGADSKSRFFYTLSNRNIAHTFSDAT